MDSPERHPNTTTKKNQKDLFQHVVLKDTNTSRTHFSSYPPSKTPQATTVTDKGVGSTNTLTSVCWIQELPSQT